MICDACGEECSAVNRDFGIGAYEYGGAFGVDRDVCAVSPCCEADVVEGGEKLVRSSVHVARRDHKDGKVKAGEKYRVQVYRHWRGGGPHWITTKKLKLGS